MDSKSLINNFNQVGGMSAVMLGGGIVMFIAGIIALTNACPNDAFDEKTGCAENAKATVMYKALKYGGIIFCILGMFVGWLGATAEQ